MTTLEHMRAVETHSDYGQTRMHQAYLLLRLRRGCTAGTSGFNCCHYYLWAASLRAGWEQLEDGPRRHRSRGSTTLSGLLRDDVFFLATKFTFWLQ
jgi:hypothetical protein